MTNMKKTIFPVPEKKILLLFIIFLLVSISFVIQHHDIYSLRKEITASFSYSSYINSFDDTKDKFDVCIVGAGLSGSVIAERYASTQNKTVLILEKRDHIGGNCYDYIDNETGIRVSKFGAHLFHTEHEDVWEYVNRFGEWTKYEHKVRGIVNGKYVPIPVNIETVNTLFHENIKNSFEMDKWLIKNRIKNEGPPKNSEEVALERVGTTLYSLIFKPYTFKQWGKYPEELGPEVLSRIPVRNNFEDRYFSDVHQAIPTYGYTSIFESMLSNPLIKIRTSIDYFNVKNEIKCGKLYFTGPIDAYFARLNWPKLEYRSLSFERRVEKDTDFYQPNFVVNHPQADVDYTRIVEYKHLLNQTSPHTVYFIERSTDDGEPYYPVPNERNKDLFERYKEMANKEKNVMFVGRLASYKYFNMDQAIKNALNQFYEDILFDEFGETYWCVLTRDTVTFPQYFDHFPHAAEDLLPCWSWFRHMGVTDKCGFILQDGLKIDRDKKNTWQKQLVDAMGCKLKEFEESFSVPSNDFFHVSNLQLKLPRFGQRVYLERPEDAYALRNRIVPQDIIESRKGVGKPLQIGFVQRSYKSGRVIRNINKIVDELQKNLPEANITITELTDFDLKQQATWFATKDVIIATHGAALTNSVFITRGTIVMQIYPIDFFFQSLDPLIEQAGGVALDWYFGNEPHVDWVISKRKGFQNRTRMAKYITPPVDEIVKPILFALGLEMPDLKLRGDINSYGIHLENLMREIDDLKKAQLPSINN